MYKYMAYGPEGNIRPEDLGINTETAENDKGKIDEIVDRIPKDALKEVAKAKAVKGKTEIVEGKEGR